MGILAAIGQGLRAIANYFGWARQRDEEKNSPPMQAAAKQKQEQAEIDRINQDVAKGDLNEIRKDIAE